MLGITTFPPSHWDYYAGLCVERMSKLWPGPVRVYYEGPAPPALEGIEARPLHSKDRAEFLKRKIVPPTYTSNTFLWDAKRFCHKVFAQLDAMEDGEPFWWIDADVLMTRPLLEALVQQTEMVTFLGRNTYTETGLVGFNPKHPDFSAFKERYRAMYTEGDLLKLPCWTDCHAFDAAREGKGEDLTPHGRGFNNVMADSKFGPYMVHYKGPRKAELQALGGANEVSANL